jgi:hypothetical protein
LFLDIKFEKEMNIFIESNGYLKNEIKLIKSVEKLAHSKKEFTEAKHDEENREYLHNFTDEQINKIKEIVNKY